MAITGSYGRFICDSDDELASLAVNAAEGFECYQRSTPSKFYKYIDGDWRLIGGVIVAQVTTAFPSFTGNELKFLRLSSGGVNLEFAALAGGGDMLAANNLSDLEDITEAVTNLGIPDLIADAYNDAIARANHTGTQAISTITGLQTELDDINTELSGKEDAGVAATLADAAEAAANDYTDAEILELKDGVSGSGDTLQKLYNLITAALNEAVVANLEARDAYDVPSLPFNIFVTDDGDTRWALYKATTTGVGATFIKISDPDLLNAAMSNAQIKTAYESNADTNAFTNALKAKLDAIASGATANATNAELRDRSTHTGTQLAATISDFNAAALSAAPAETPTTMGALINAATEKTTPVDADFFELMDSAASNIVKKFSWANMKAKLKTYFDTIYTTTALVATQITTALSPYAPLASPGFTGTPTFASGINTTELPHGIVIGNTAEQSQLVVSATNYYITSSKFTLPNPLKGGMKVGTKFTWEIAMTKTAAGTGIFQISIYRGTNGTTADTQDVLQTIGTQTAVVDSMIFKVCVTVTATGATGSYFWTITPVNKAVTATGFGVATGTTGYFSGTVSSVALNTASLIFGIGFKATTGTPTIRVSQVHGQAFNIN